jgi:hypothetical protein
VVTDMPAGFDDPQPLVTDELGTTYRARQADPGRDVGLRILSLALPARPARRQFRSSCVAAADLAGHPGVLALYVLDFTPGNHPYLVTERPDGSLAQRLAAHGAAPVGYAARVGTALAQTLMAAHAKGILHQDVRPENVVHTESAGPLLAYFGVSRAVAALGQAELPPASMVHAARELFGWETPGPAADVYGLASTLYTMLAGQPAYAPEARLGRAALYQRLLRGGPPPIPRGDLPRALAELLSDMMAPDPASRPAMSVAAGALAEFADDAPPAAALITPPRQVRVSAASPAGKPAGEAPTGTAPTGTAPTGTAPASTAPASTAPMGVTPAYAPPQPPPPLDPAYSPPQPLIPGSLNEPGAPLVSLGRHPSAFDVAPPVAAAAAGPGEAPSAVARALNPATPRTRAADPPAAARGLIQPPPALGLHHPQPEPGPGRALAAPGLDQPQPAQAPAKHRHTGLILLVAAGVVALLAGVVWGAVTAPRSPQGAPAPKITDTSAASPMPAGQQGAYRVGGVTLTALAHGARVSWSAPRSSNGVTAFIVVAELANQAEQEHTVGAHARSAVFTGLQAGQRYCFVVGTLVESADGRPGTAATRPVCAVVPASAPASS